MIEEEKELKKKDALKDYNFAKSELKKSKFRHIRKILIVLGILFVVAVIIRIVHGKIYYSVSFMPLNKSVEYKLYVNGEHKTISFEDIEDSMIIPGLFYFRRSNFGSWFNMDKLNEDLVLESEKIQLDFVVNACYTHTDKIRVNCESGNEKLIRKEVKPKFKSIFIRKNGKKEKIMYDGKYISNISPYVKEKGYYYIEINAEYDGIDTTLILFFERKENVE